MPSFGERLRRERLKQGLDIQDVAARTRINARYLSAIENDDVDSLPGKFFFRSFVRQYALALGLEETAFDEEIREVLGRGEAAPEVPAPPPPHIDVPPILTGAARRTNRIPGSAIVLLAVIIACAGLFGWWQRARTPAMEPLPAAAPAPVPADAGPAAQSPAAAPGTLAMPVSGAPEGAKPSAAEPVPASVPPTETPTEAPAPKPPAAPGPLGSGPITVEVTANEPVWVNIVSDGRDLVTRVLQPGDSRVVRGSGEIRILSGNAGGMSVRVNGQPVEDVGPRGQVRVITVTPEGTRVASPRRAEPPQPSEPPQ